MTWSRWLPTGFQTRDGRPKSANFSISNSKPFNSQSLIVICSIMSIHIYAEHLINIRTLTIQISLPTNSDGSTALSLDGSILALSHQGETAKITLPVSIPDSERVKLRVPPAPSTNLSFRMRLDGTSPQNTQSTETIIPWTATSLSHEVELRCKTCHVEILPRRQIQTWKDLPSEGWAEMMEFWHCHKPNEPHDHEHQTDKKGYSANSMLAITPSVGLVNATSFVLTADDCKNIKVGHRASFILLTKEPTTWALKRTGAFQPQGYYIWKIRDIAALKQSLLSERGISCNPCESCGFSGEALNVLANSFVAS